MSEPKKVSFGFKSTKKLVAIQKPIVEPKKVELIDCLEGKSIRVKNEVKTTKAPLVIPVKDNGKNLLDRVRDANDLKERSRKKLAVEDDRPDSELTLDELAARQLIREAKNFESKPNAAKVHVLPALEDKLLLEGSVEPTLEDYENVPIGDYGMAMLRGMGWTATAGVGKNSKMTTTASPAPEMRPKGMGLGAGRLMAQEKTKPAIDKDGKELTLHKGVYARIVAGKLKGNYCIVQGLDDEAGRVIVKTTLMGTVLSLNEFLLTPVTKEEYIRSAKVLNNAKYEEYKNQEARTDDAARQNGRVRPEKDCSKPSRNSLEYEMQKKTAAQPSGSDKKHKTVDEDPPKKKNGDSKNTKHQKNYRRRPSSSESEDVVETRRSSSKSSAKKYGDERKKKKRDSSDSSSRSYRSASREYEDKAKKQKKGKAEKYKGRRRSSESSSSDSEYDSRRGRYRRSSSRSSYGRSSSDRDRYKRRRRSSSYSDRDDRRSRSRRRSYTPRSSRSRSTDSDRRRGRGSRRYSSDSYSD